MDKSDFLVEYPVIFTFDPRRTAVLLIIRRYFFNSDTYISNSYLKCDFKFVLTDLGSGIGRFRKLFTGWNIKPGIIDSLMDQSVPLNDILAAVALPDYLSAIGK